ncbi:MAG: hypothetical protein HYY09_00090 [Firmicutes bacterium]|nr:hypothetical protein [Bacillota bacterium]
MENGDLQIQKAGPRAGRDTGSVLMVVLWGGLVLMTLAGAAVSLGGASLRVQNTVRDRVTAVYAAESGLSEALYRLKYRSSEQIPGRTHPGEDPSFNSVTGLLGDSAGYRVWVWDEPGNENLKHLVSEGTVGRSTRRVKITSSPEEGLPFPGALVESGGVIDPRIILPTGLASSGQLLIRDTDVTITPGTYLYDQIDSAGNGNLILTGRTTLYIAGDIKITGTGIINTTLQAENLIIFVPTDNTDVEIDLRGGGAFYGGIYAPSADIDVVGSQTVTGSLVGSSVNLSGGASVTYDSDLALVGYPPGTELDWIANPGSWE